MHTHLIFLFFLPITCTLNNQNFKIFWKCTQLSFPPIQDSVQLAVLTFQQNEEKAKRIASVFKNTKAGPTSTPQLNTSCSRVNLLCHATGNAVIALVKTLPMCIPLTLLEHQPLKSHMLVQSALSYSGNTPSECGAKDLSTSVYSKEEHLYLVLDKNDLCIPSFIISQIKVQQFSTNSWKLWKYSG